MPFARGHEKEESMQDKLKRNAKEAQELVVAGLKLGTVLVPLVVAVRLGLPKLSTDELMAIALLVAGVGMGVYWLRTNQK